MRRILTAVALGAITMVAPALVPAAEADDLDFVFGASFRIGGAHFNIGYFPTVHAPVYYYRTRAPLDYHGHRCHDRCYHRGGYSYHHASCPLIQRHFRHYRYEPQTVFVRYAPRFRGHGRYHHDRHDRGRDVRHHDFDRGHSRRHDHDRWDRRDRDRRPDHDRRWDRRDRDRRHDHRDHGRGVRRGDDDDRGRHGRRDRGRDRGDHRDRHGHDD
jgi:hypothetical protein